MNKTDLYNKIKNQDITESSAKIYTSNLIKISKDFNIKLDENSFQDLEIIDKIKLSDQSENTKKNKINSIIIYLKAFGAPQNINDRYNDEADKYTTKINRKNKKLEKTEKENKNWVTIDEIKNKISDLKKKIKDDIIINYDYIKNYMKYILLNIHIFAPMRNDLSDAVFIDYKTFKKNDIDKTKNYIIITPKNGCIILYNFKTFKSKGIQKIDIDDDDLLKELNKYKSVINKYKKDNNIINDWFIFDKKGDKITRNEYTKLFNEIFDNKKISTTMIRKIIVSNTWNIKEIKKLSDKMQHTPQQALNNYVKIDK